MDDLSLAVGFGGGRIWPFVSPLLVLSRNLSVQVLFSVPACVNAICATPITEKVVVERNIT